MELLKIEYKGIKAVYSPHDKGDESNGLLIVNASNGVESSHIINGWAITRIMQYIESMKNLV